MSGKMTITELTIDVLITRAKRLRALEAQFAPIAVGLTEDEMREMDSLKTLFGWEGARLALLLETAMDLLDKAEHAYYDESRTHEGVMMKIRRFLGRAD